MSKAILLELNEVPFRVIDWYAGRRPESAFARLLRRSDQFETVTPDELALDPWISWPTLHRGVPDTKHRILHLGQPLGQVDSKYPPIWRILKDAGLSVGVFGSLHSSAIPDDANDYAFYVPDYFDNELFAHPRQLRAFQALNLRMTRESARNVARKVPLAEAIEFALRAPALGVRPRTAVRVAQHLAREVYRPSTRIRRRNLQPLLSMDLFVRLLERTQPDFATFYTNHVAASMHRYWGAAFPDDYADGVLEREWVDKYGSEILAAMDTFDDLLAALQRFLDRHLEYRLVIASSMGQAAIDARHTYEFLTVTDLSRFMSALGLSTDDWSSRPAMVPCQCVVVSPTRKQQLVDALRSLSIAGHSMVESVSPRAPMSFDDRGDDFFQIFIQFDHYGGGSTAHLNGRPIDLESMGIGMMAHEDGVNCTAQHVPTGSLIVHNAASPIEPPATRPTISSTDIAPILLAHLGVATPDFMGSAARSS